MDDGGGYMWITGERFLEVFCLHWEWIARCQWQDRIGVMIGV